MESGKVERRNIFAQLNNFLGTFFTIIRPNRNQPRQPKQYLSKKNSKLFSNLLVFNKNHK